MPSRGTSTQLANTSPANKAAIQWLCRAMRFPCVRHALLKRYRRSKKLQSGLASASAVPQFIFTALQQSRVTRRIHQGEFDIVE